MNEAPAAQDAAWARVELPLEAQPLHRFLADPERLLRLNPLLEFERIERQPDGALHLLGRNESNGQALDVRVRVAESLPGRRLVLRYESGIKRETRCEIEAAGSGAVLTLTEIYDPPPEAEHARVLEQVDRSLVPWAASLRRVLVHARRWGRLPGYGRLFGRWLAMTPRQRRVSKLIVWSTVVEFVVFLLVVGIYAIEQARA